MCERWKFSAMFVEDFSQLIALSIVEYARCCDATLLEMRWFKGTALGFNFFKKPNKACARK